METIKLGVLVNNAGVLKKFEEIPLRSLSGKKALELRRALKKIQEEIQVFEDAKDQYVRENGEPDEAGNVNIKDPHMIKKAYQFLEDMAQTEVSVTWQPVLDDTTIEVIATNIDLTIRDLDVIEEIKLM